MKKIILAILLLCFFSASIATAKIYQWRDENGKLIFSDKPRYVEKKSEAQEVRLPKEKTLDNAGRDLVDCSLFYQVQAQTEKKGSIASTKAKDLGVQLLAIAIDEYGKEPAVEYFDEEKKKIIKKLESPNINKHFLFLEMDKIKECRDITRENGIIWSLYDE